MSENELTMADGDITVAPRVVGTADTETVDCNEAAVAVRAVAGDDVAARAARRAATALEPVHARLVAGLAHTALGVPHARAPRTVRDHRVLLVAVRVHGSAVRAEVKHQALGHCRDVRAICDTHALHKKTEWMGVDWRGAGGCTNIVVCGRPLSPQLGMMGRHQWQCSSVHPYSGSCGRKR